MSASSIESSSRPVFLQFSIIKYVCRYQEKGGKQDLEKAKHLIEWMIEDLPADPIVSASAAALIEKSIECVDCD